MQLKTCAFIFGTIAILRSSGEKFFRRDYTYYEEHNAFYKLHRADGSSWEEAFITCDDEGAKLFYPEGPEERTVVANLTELLPSVEEIFVGIRDEFNLGQFVSVDGRFISELSNYDTSRDEAGSKCIVMSVTTGSYSVVPCEHKRAFICKKIDNESCPTIDSAYVYSKATNKCYKVNKGPKTWQDAVNTCYMEGAILSTFEGNIKSTFLPNLIQDKGLFFIGIRRILPQSSFYSLQGSKFEFPEENNYNENCATIGLNTRYDDNGLDCHEYARPKTYVIRSHSCSTMLPFVCEMKITV